MNANDTHAIILASSSTYRAEQLRRLNIAFDIQSPNVDENALKQQKLHPVALSERLALKKAHAVSEQHRDAIVIGGDQVLSFEGEIFSKPITEQTARAQLARLSGSIHQLITSVAIIKGEKEYLYTCTANMTMRVLSAEQIERYVQADEPLFCCGAYRLEAGGIALFESIDCEDHTSIIGIPLLWTAKTLSALGVAIP